VFEIIIFWLGCPINGVAFGLFVGDDDGDSVRNIKFASPSTYLYLIAFCVVLTSFVTTGSQKKQDVMTLKKFGEALNHIITKHVTKNHAG
jgi:hypothetical protein